MERMKDDREVKACLCLGIIALRCIRGYTHILKLVCVYVSLRIVHASKCMYGCVYK